LAGRVKTIAEPIDNGLAGVRPREKVPVVVAPTTLSAATEFVAAATEATVEPAAKTFTPDEAEEITPPKVDNACREKVPLAVFVAILQLVPAVMVRVVAVVVKLAVATVHFIVVKPADPVAPGHAATGGESVVVQIPVVVPAAPVV